MTFRNSTHEGVHRVVLDNLGQGSVTIEPGVQPDLVECSINAGQEEFLTAVQVRQERDALRISFPPKTFRHTNAHLRLGVPPDLEYVVKVGSADVSVRAAIGRSRIMTGSGDISIDRARDLVAATGSGDVSVGELDGTEARLSSGSGDISVGEVGCPVMVKSGSGEVTVKRVRTSYVQAGSGSGDITVAATSGSVDLRTASGSRHRRRGRRAARLARPGLRLRRGPDRPGVDPPAGARSGVRLDPGHHRLRRHRRLPRLTPRRAVPGPATPPRNHPPSRARAPARPIHARRGHARPGTALLPDLDGGAVEVQVRAARGGAALVLVVRAGLRGPVRVLGR